MKIATLGLGYVGLPLSIQFAGAGVEVIGIDIDPLKVEKINRGESYIQYIDDQELSRCIKKGVLTASTDFSRITEVEAVLICVPTPLSQYRDPDLSYVLQTAQSLAPYLQKNTLVVLESTTYPGTTEEELRHVLEAGSGFKAGIDFYLAYSPEREDPGNPHSRVDCIPKIVGGLTPICQGKAVELYQKVVKEVVSVSSCRVAEATKLLENIFRAVNIALVNELKMVYTAMGIDIWEVIEAAKTKPFGYMPFYPGPGLGGHCIPIDPFYLAWKARASQQSTRFIELAGEINTAMPQYVIHQVAEALNNQSKSIKGSRILILGLAYKAEVDDERESPSYVLMEKLEEKGAEVFYHDPYIPQIPQTRDHADFAGRKSQPISEDYDLILVATAHSIYKTMNFSHLRIPVVDTRNCLVKKPPLYYRA